MVFSVADIPDLTGKVVIVTGGNSGIGEISCKELAAKGAKVFMASRSESKAQEAIEKIKKVHPGADIQTLQLDLTDLSSVKSAAENFKAQNPRLDILLNNAGIMATPYTLTKDGLELQFATNVVGHYLFSMLLLPTLVETSKLAEYQEKDASVRIVQVSSLVHTMADKDTSFENLEEVNKQYKPEAKGTWTRYGKSKLGNILLANEIERLLPKGTKVSNISLHPGVINTGLMRGPFESYGFLLKWITYPFSRLFLTAPSQGALTQLYASTSPEVVSQNLSGEYLIPTAQVGIKSRLARDADGKLGAQLVRFCKNIVKEKVDVDVDAILAEAGLSSPQA